MSQQVHLRGFRYRADHFGPPPSLLKKMLAAVINKADIDKVAEALGGLSVKDALNTASAPAYLLIGARPMSEGGCK